ncbi:hypoxia induced protein conserved region-domain-containing protein [Lasiosphaeria miniovina]|uniref:Hypoxia induced protein conserved region-domain-containing protein n=1 Tax=Lasiosphaeria miniovina TaxID=1954250 RepID=A0AA40DRV2_9PEZI|nr:hypoxia induced protein conserved region-domain-containing protein [Lasiosphaeria miniovina]KAK0713869.1 hypoxia induced protein conserved region-domain-containing protein [Lasiosphaeria miniovina]
MSNRSMPSSFDDDEQFYKESGLQQVIKKLKREPLIPIGCLLTVAAFTGAYRASRRGDHHQVQRMFRARIAAQGFTIVAIVAGGIYYSEDRERKKEFRKQQHLQESEDKRKKWIKELEARDEEDRALREKLERRRQRASERSSTESSSEGIVAQAKALLQDSKEPKDTTQEYDNPATTASGDKIGSTGPLSLNGWFGVLKKTPGDKEDSVEGPKRDPGPSER